MGSIVSTWKHETVEELSRETGTAMPIAKLVTELHRLLVAQGLGEADNAAMIRLYDKPED